jgi:hypothetical protein
MCDLCVFYGDEGVSSAPLVNQPRGVYLPGVHVRAHDISHQVGARYSSLSSSSTPTTPPSSAPLLHPLTMPRGGDGVACRAASHDEEQSVPRSVALARQHALETARHAPVPPLAAGVVVPSSELESATRRRGRSTGGAAAKGPQGGAEGATGGEDDGRMCPPPLPQPSAPCAEGPRVGQRGTGSGANGSTHFGLKKLPKHLEQEIPARVCSPYKFSDFFVTQIQLKFKL